jgi:predicted PurR-regulated permease PerM
MTSRDSLAADRHGMRGETDPLVSGKEEGRRSADVRASAVELEVPWRTILRLLFAAVLVWACLHLQNLFTVLVVAVILAVTITPLIELAAAHGVRRGVGALLVGLVVLAVVAAAGAFAAPVLDHQAQLLGTRLTATIDEVRAHLPAPVNDLLQTPAGKPPPVAEMAQYAVSFGQRIAADTVLAVFAFILSLYLVVEGERTYEWLLAYVPRHHRPRANLTAREARRLIAAYVIGNLITSGIAAVFAFAVLAVLHVPAALVLGVLAGLLDLIPVLGFLVFTGTAMLVAASVSAATALTVLMAYSAYHFFENYYLVPLVYGERLRLSMVAVLLAFAVGGELGGVLGALIALPVAAAYPAVERIWLRDYLAADTVAEHVRIESEPED